MSRPIDADALKIHYAWWDDEEEKRLFNDIVDAQPTLGKNDPALLAAFVSEPIAEQFRVKCEEHDTTAGELIRAFVFSVAVGALKLNEVLKEAK